MQNVFKNQSSNHYEKLKKRAFWIIIIFSLLFIAYLFKIKCSLNHTLGRNDNSNSTFPIENTTIDTSLNKIRRILDSSLASNGFVYYYHYNILAPDERFNTVSFIYSKENIGNFPNIDELDSLAKYSENLRTKGISLMQESQINGNNELAQEAASMMIEADRLLSQEDNFYTIEIGNDLNLPPIVMVHPGLPEWIILRGKAQFIANTHFSNKAKLVGIERSTIGANCIFIAMNPEGDSIYIDARANTTYTKRLLKTTNRYPLHYDSQKERERAERIKFQWQEFMKKGIEINDFSLNGLTDLSNKK